MVPKIKLLHKIASDGEKRSKSRVVCLYKAVRGAKKAVRQDKYVHVQTDYLRHTTWVTIQQ